MFFFNFVKIVEILIVNMKFKKIKLFKITPNQVTSLRAKTYRLIRSLIMGLILAMSVNFVVFNFFHSPKAYSLIKENNEVRLKYKLLSNKMSLSKDRLNNIKNRQEGTYKTMFALESITPVLDNSYIFDNNIDEYNNHQYNYLLENLWNETNKFKLELYSQSIFLDSIQILTKDKEKMLEAIPIVWPLDRTKLRGKVGAFGYRFHPIQRVRKMHDGVDLSGPTGLPIYSTSNGKVVVSGRESGYGLTVVVDHGYGYKTRYAHLNKIRVKKGQVVRRGEQIGDLGNTGRSTGPHLHYEVIYRNHHVNPINYLKRHMSSGEFSEFIENVAETTYEE